MSRSLSDPARNKCPQLNRKLLWCSTGCNPILGCTARVWCRRNKTVEHFVAQPTTKTSSNFLWCSEREYYVHRRLKGHQRDSVASYAKQAQSEWLDLPGFSRYICLLCSVHRPWLRDPCDCKFPVQSGKNWTIETVHQVLESVPSVRSADLQETTAKSRRYSLLPSLHWSRSLHGAEDFDELITVSLFLLAAV